MLMDMRMMSFELVHMRRSIDFKWTYVTVYDFVYIIMSAFKGL